MEKMLCMNGTGHCHCLCECTHCRRLLVCEHWVSARASLLLCACTRIVAVCVHTCCHCVCAHVLLLCVCTCIVAVCVHVCVVVRPLPLYVCAHRCWVWLLSRCVRVQRWVDNDVLLCVHSVDDALHGCVHMHGVVVISSGQSAMSAKNSVLAEPVSQMAPLWVFDTSSPARFM
jgi:hypothetical protein